MHESLIMPADPENLTEWARFLSNAEIPVLRKTMRSLTALRAQAATPGVRDVAVIIKQDPLMMTELLRYLQQQKHQRQEHEVMQVEQALMMLGVENALDHIATKPLVETVLHAHPSALVQLLHRVHRAHVASNYALEWAIHLQDIHFEEIRTAALLHDITELLLWCFSPARMLALDTNLQDPAAHRRTAQEQVFGFALNDLQSRLVAEWSLPALLITLMDDASSAQPRVRNVRLAVDLARHAAHGWDNEKLHGDLTAISELLRTSVDEVKIMVGAPG
ncbi:HDOD domain-containing protein [Nitrosomonas halophila]|uniref:HD-like signal output (HDOD) domain, no enzymatic activity n=1 Tax=Nitrosomonas halophila TaxID=44576 RepID=A0A1H3K6Y9_9PROT|nr:HDOD domain-containing protein [Nitrosomonas halophila]SDY47629.1 HD-like signal output (HDOD) domain, no enzymatic activity [Nitrosomonas halophila]